MFFSFAMIIYGLFLDVLVVVFFNSTFKFAGMFSLFIQLYTSCSIAESISSSRNNHLRSITYFYLRKPAHDRTDRSLSILCF